MRKAVITIEVLISMLILFLVVATSVTALKHSFLVELKKDKYQSYYYIFFNIKSSIESEICQSKQYLEGRIDDFVFSATCYRKKRLLSYVKSLEPDEPYGNIGPVQYTLYEIKINLRKGLYDEVYTYYKTIAEQIR